MTPKAEIDALVTGLDRHPQVAVLSGEIYGTMTYDGEAHVSLLRYPEIRDRLIHLDGASKTYAMTGWRLGWSVWPKPLYDAARKLAVNSFSCVNAATQWAGIAALDGDQDCVAAMVSAFDRRRRLVVDGLNRCRGSPASRRRAPSMPSRISARRAGSEALAAALLEVGRRDHRRADFGIGEGYIRLSYANSEENIGRALDRMGDFLARRKAAC